MQVWRRERHCLAASSMTDRLVVVFPLFDETRLQFGDVVNPAAISRLLTPVLILINIF